MYSCGVAGYFTINFAALDSGAGLAAAVPGASPESG
jgi:hypothetical protein